MRQNIFFILAMFVGLVGCSGDKQEQEGASQAPVKAEVKDQVASTAQSNQSEQDQKLIGLWFGGAYLERDQVNSTIESLADEAEKTSLLQKANTFLTTEMAMEFRPDGTVEQNIEMVIGNERPNVTTLGRWKIIDHQDNKLVVEIVEIANDGKETSKEWLYQFATDEQFAMPAPVDEQLSSFNPLLIFNRIPDLEDDRTAGAVPDSQTLR